ncbi:MAG TPA: ComF family protein [Candidatus Omnitrophota bacterium]|nr:ComF family protein [Candidatus Omnitrophota bacterium]
MLTCFPVVNEITLMYFLEAFLNLIYPPQCWLCHATLAERRQTLCVSCREKIRHNIPPFCARCSRPLEKLSRSICHQCQKRLPDFDQSWAATIYNDAMKELLHQFKYKGKTGLRHFFADLLFVFIERYKVPVQQFDLLVPMPIHSAKYREREFNQTVLLAELLSKHFSLTCCDHNLARVAHGPAQALLSEKERWTNVQGAFRIRQPQKIKNKSILIIDDLITTGATASSAAITCRKAGARTVGILALSIGQ